MVDMRTSKYTWPADDIESWSGWHFDDSLSDGGRLTTYHISGPGKFGVDLMFVGRTQSWFWSIWTSGIKGTLTTGLAPTRADAQAAALDALNSGRVPTMMRRRAMADVKW